MRPFLFLTTVLFACNSASAPPASEDSGLAHTEETSPGAVGASFTEDAHTSFPTVSPTSAEFTGATTSEPHQYRCEEVSSIPGDTLNTMKAFAGQLFTGHAPDYIAASSVLFRYPQWAQVLPGVSANQSICALEEFDGTLFANTEGSGDLLRSTDGLSWTVVYEGEPGVIGCGLEVHDGALYAVNFNYDSQNNGQILRTTNGTLFEEVWSGESWSPYLRDLVSHDGSIYAFASNTDTGQGFWLRSTLGEDWALVETPSWFLHSISWQGELYASSTDISSNGPAGIYRIIGDEAELVYTTVGHAVAEFHGWDGVLFAGTQGDWTDKNGVSSLLMSRDGDSWQAVCDFDEINATTLEVYDGNLYVGTSEPTGGSKLFKVVAEAFEGGSNTSIEPTEPVDPCPEDPNNPPTTLELNYLQATYESRHNWVLSCFPYAYTAGDAEHMDCDGQYNPDGSRTGKALFDFEQVPQGMYVVEINARHTESRNPAGALFIVDGVSKNINQVDSSLAYYWDYHGTYCLSGDVQVVLDSSVNNGSDDVLSVRLTPQ